MPTAVIILFSSSLKCPKYSCGLIFHWCFSSCPKTVENKKYIPRVKLRHITFSRNTFRRHFDTACIVWIIVSFDVQTLVCLQRATRLQITVLFTIMLKQCFLWFGPSAYDFDVNYYNIPFTIFVKAIGSSTWITLSSVCLIITLFRYVPISFI